MTGPAFLEWCRNRNEVQIFKNRTAHPQLPQGWRWWTQLIDTNAEAMTRLETVLNRAVRVEFTQTLDGNPFSHMYFHVRAKLPGYRFEFWYGWCD